MLKIYQSKGFSLVELLVAMVVGLIIVTGVFSLHSATRDTQKVNEAQMDMVADARFAINTISYDLRHAGMWGATNKDGVVECRSTDAACVGADKPTAVTGDCSVDWSYNLTRPIFAVDGNNTGYGSCVPATDYVATTDVLEVRYADSNELATGLRAGQVYVRSNYTSGKVFVGTTAPTLAANDTGAGDLVTRDYILHAFAYYISNNSDATGDGIPSLRRAALVEGPQIRDQLLVSGVVDMQVQFGIDLDGVKDANGSVTIDSYVNASAITDVNDWVNVYAARIWLVMRTDETRLGMNNAQSFNIAGASKSFPATGTDDYRYYMVSSTVNLRNMKQL